VYIIHLTMMLLLQSRDREHAVGPPRDDAPHASAQYVTQCCSHYI